MADKEQIDKLISMVSSRLGANEDEVRGAVEGGKYEKILTKMSPEQVKGFQNVLSDEESAKKFLSTPQAQAIIRKLMG